MLCDDEFRISEKELEDDPGLVPPFAPPLQGRLVVWRLSGVGLFKNMIRSFGGINFSALNIFDVEEAPLLLSTCAETLQNLQLNPTDPRGE